MAIPGTPSGSSGSAASTIVEQTDLTTFGINSLGGMMAGLNLVTPVSVAIGSNAHFYPIRVTNDIAAASGIGWHNGATVNGNIHAALYTSTGDGTFTQVTGGIVTVGAQAGVNSYQSAAFSGGDIALTAGLYWLAVRPSGGTATFFSYAVDADWCRMLGAATRTGGSSTLGAVETPTAYPSNLPLMQIIDAARDF